MRKDRLREIHTLSVIMSAEELFEAKGYDATKKEQDLLETLKLSLEATARGFKFGLIDLEKSDDKNFVLDEDEKTIICPFRVLDGLGVEVSKQIIEARKAEMMDAFQLTSELIE